MKLHNAFYQLGYFQLGLAKVSLSMAKGIQIVQMKACTPPPPTIIKY